MSLQPQPTERHERLCHSKAVAALAGGVPIAFMLYGNQKLFRQPAPGLWKERHGQNLEREERQNVGAPRMSPLMIKDDPDLLRSNAP